MSEGIRLQMVSPVRAAIKILQLVAALLFQKLLPGSNKIPVPLGGRPPYMSGMKETVLMLFCLGQAAYYEDMSELDSRTRAELTVLSVYSRKDRYLQITTSTKRAQAGEYAVFHVMTNFYLKSFDYLVVAKGIIVQSGTEKVYGMLHSITTFSVPVSPEMAPVFHIVVYHITSDGEVLTDSVILPVDAINKHKFILDVNMKQERSGNLIELIPRLTSESNIGIWGFDSDHISTHGRQQLTVTSCMDEGVPVCRRIVSTSNLPPQSIPHFQWGLDLENALAIRDVEYPRCVDNHEQRVFDDMLRCRP
ncbi:macroglobulin complement-related [Trichonephila clavipes]|nr:macroglobulin complement-related [Trichonephila clavipes]